MQSTFVPPFRFLFSKTLEKLQILPQQSQPPLHLRKMGNKRNRRSRILETPSSGRDLSEAQVETPNKDNKTLINVNTVVQESLSGDETRPQLVESNQISNDIQAWTENVKQKNNDKIIKMREIEIKFDAILKEIRTNKSASTITSPISGMNGIQNHHPLGSKNERSNGVHASNTEDSDTKNEDDHPLRASDMRELRNLARPLDQSTLNLDETIISEEDSVEDAYHTSNQIL